MLTFVLVAVAVATFVAAWRSRRARRCAGWRCVLALAIPAQAVIGGITVLTDLNPWIVSFHLLLSLAMVGVAVVFLRRIDHPDPVRARGPLVGAGLADLRRGLGGALRRHGGDRLRSARR